VVKMILLPDGRQRKSRGEGGKQEQTEPTEKEGNPPLRRSPDGLESWERGKDQKKKGSHCSALE